MTFTKKKLLFMFLSWISVNGFVVPCNDIIDYGRFIRSERKVYEDYGRYLKQPDRNESTPSSIQQKVFTR